jgi:hypothetical protein
MFNASPEGNGIDCHRTWESLYLGTVPVVEKNLSTEYWQSIGVPLFLIKSWNDVKNLKSEQLIKEYKELENKLGSEVIYMKYWMEKILTYKK